MGWRIGDVEITAIVDEDNFEIALDRMFPSARPEALQSHRWLAPHHFDFGRCIVKLGMHSFLLRTPTLNVLVDTCVGAAKERPAHSAWHQRGGERFLSELHAQGMGPEDIDLIFCTHLHADHVGWNTRLQDGRWVPTFPRARYCISEIELAYWRAAQAQSSTPVNHGALQDSILPIVETGQALFASAGDTLLPGLSVVALSGHTLDHRGLELNRAGERGLFSGDAIHSPLQLVEPRWASAFCADPDGAIQTRLAILNRVVDENMLLFPAHFRGERAMRLFRVNGHFRPAS